jgi:hypothetical protein
MIDEKRLIKTSNVSIKSYFILDIFYLVMFSIANFYDKNFFPGFEGLPLENTYFMVILLITIVGLAIVIPMSFMIGYAIFIYSKKKKWNRRYIILPLFQISAPIEIFFLYFSFKIENLIIWAIILILITLPLFRSILNNIKLNYYSLESSKKLFINAYTSQESIALAIFSFNIAKFLGFYIYSLFFLLLIYLKYPMKYFFFDRNKFKDFYKKVRRFYHIIDVFILFPFTLLNVIWSGIYMYFYFLPYL